jgi:hypothetical protein
VRSARFTLSLHGEPYTRSQAVEATIYVAGRTIWTKTVWHDEDDPGRAESEAWDLFADRLREVMDGAVTELSYR